MAKETYTIGKARTVLVFGRGSTAKAAISDVSARTRRSNRDRLIFTGPVAVDAVATEHLRETVLPIVDRIVKSLGLRRRSFEVSITNLAAASSVDLGLRVSGFSADAAMLLALLSAALKMPLPQDVVVTGHVASPEGDIRPVRSLPAKLSAAIEDPRVRRFVYPALDEDRSLKKLGPSERERGVEALIEAKGRIGLAEVADVCQLFKEVLNDEAVALGALRSGFYQRTEGLGHDEISLQSVAAFLAHNNERRFWDALERHLLHSRSAPAKRLLQTLAQYHVRRKAYPKSLGRRLLELIRSLPPATRRLRIRFPLLPENRCEELRGLAGRRDREDAQWLSDAAFGKGFGREKGSSGNEKAGIAVSTNAGAALDALLAEINAEALANSVGLPIDAARAAYALNEVIVDSYDVFQETVSAFYLSLVRRAGLAVPAGSETIEAEARDLVERAFRDKGGWNAAWAEARHGIHGGMRFILDAMTEQYKTEQQAKRVSRALKAVLDPLDWDARVEFMAAFMDRLRLHLPREIMDQPPARFAYHYEPIVRTYVRSLDGVKQLLRAL